MDGRKIFAAGYDGEIKSEEGNVKVYNAHQLAFINLTTVLSYEKLSDSLYF
jgi:hypothetical protein